MADLHGCSPADAALALIGRNREQVELRAALDAALAGHGSLVLIGGEAGIGKTTLAEAFLAEAAERGALVLVGRCYDLAETPPYGPWRELFARAPDDDTLPALPAATLPPERGGETLANQGAILARAAAYLAALADARPLVLLLEDLHWSDPASLDLLRVAGRGLGERPILLLATYRADEVAGNGPLAPVLPALVREARAARLDLRPLDQAAIGALVAARYGLPDAERNRLVRYLAARTEGNALFLGEVLRTLEGEGLLRADTRPGLVGQSSDGGDRWIVGDLDGAPVPALLRQVIAGRVARLPPETARLLAVAAIIGQEVPLAAWAALGEVSETQLLDHAERALGARLLVETPDGASVRFAHALIREALYAATPAIRRRATHRRAAEALADLPHPDPDAVANHFRLAGDPRATEWLMRAGLRARRADAWLTAIDRFTAAATILEGEAERARERGWLLFYCGLLLRFTDTDRSLRLLAEAERLATLAGDRALLAYTHYQRGPVRGMRGEVRAGLADIARGVDELDALPAEYRLRSNDTQALETITSFLPGGKKPAPARPEGARRPPPTTPQRGVLINWFGQSGHYREALAMGATFLAAMLPALGEAYPPLDPGYSGHLGHGHALAALGRPAEAQREYALARAGYATLGSWFMVAHTCWFELLMAALPYATDRLAERAGLGAEAARAWGRAWGTITTAAHAAFTDLPLALLEGRWAEARRLAQEGHHAAIIDYLLGARVALGLLDRWQGQPARAWEQVRALLPGGPGTEPGDTLFAHGIAALALAAELALDAGDLDLADRWIAAHERWLEWSGAVLWQADQHRLRARHAQVSSELAQARQHAEAALARANEPRQPLALLAAHRTLGELLNLAAERGAARTHLDAALALADACAAPYERALTLLALAELRLAEGRHDVARAALAEAHAILTDLGARPALARYERLAAQLQRPNSPPTRSSGPAHPVPALYPCRLTAREVEVLRLIAAGKSNRQMADALCRSERTVERHIENIYRKIGAHSKADATAFAFRHKLA